MRITVDTTVCSGHGRCVAVAPNVYVLDDDGLNTMRDVDVPAGLESEARRGADNCPERAITLLE